MLAWRRRGDGIHPARIVDAAHNRGTTPAWRRHKTANLAPSRRRAGATPDKRPLFAAWGRRTTGSVPAWLRRGVDTSPAQFTKLRLRGVGFTPSPRRHENIKKAQNQNYASLTPALHRLKCKKYDAWKWKYAASTPIFNTNSTLY